MTIDYNKAYQYYINNIDKSCDKRVLSEDEFHKAFPSFLNNLHMMEAMGLNYKNIPLYNEKCKTSRIINLETVLKKCN